ncbi:anti-sigma factor [Actinotalea sp.]|uniref:anti-sigma factor n=1 Tax=Actinotalea sp. TaxID=1872145 RepID=UPI002BA383A9|nr:anti-sigma factor [Actinotalea sp.]HQY32896.1 anti-sigma factor [Actinotalea sp.]HRA49870.1 anti-sigma factor [Actinotalea sp.]
MPHVEPEDLALVALGETLASPADREHLAVCDVCAAEVGALSAAVAVGRSGGGDPLVAPPPAVWDRVREELRLPDSLVPDGVTRVPPTAADQQVPEPAPVVPLARTRRRSAARSTMPWIASAAAAGVIIGGVGGAWLMGRDTGPGATVLAQATLDPLPGWEASGQAHVEELPDGSRSLVVTLDGPAADGSFHEVWLIDRDVTRLVSLGILVGDSGQFTVPPGLDLDDFAVVDVSDEPMDGDPSHSGDSIIRGVLGA